MHTERTFISSVIVSLAEHGQAATQFVTAAMDGNTTTALPDIVYSPDDPKGRVVCVELRRSTAPTLAGITVSEVLRHRKVILEANPGIVFALATNAAIVGRSGEVAERESLLILPVDWDNPSELAFQIKLIATSSA